MKKRKAAVLAVAAVFCLAACGSRSGRETAPEEMVAPEVSSEDLLVSSLEYLLEDDGTGAQAAGEAQAQEQDAAGAESAVSEKEDTAAGDAAGEEIVVYYGSGGSDELEQETVSVEAVTPEEIVSVLARHNILSLDTKVLAFEQREEEGGLILYLDLSKSAEEYLQTMSGEAESVIAASLIDTFLDNYGADAIRLTVEGKPFVLFGQEQETPFVRCTPAELTEQNAGR